MKRITRLFFLFSSFFFFARFGAAQAVTTPRQSPAAVLQQTIGLTRIAVRYSRPQVITNGNDRSGRIWGQLVPFGFQKVNFACNCEIPWRAGANENTTIEFSNDVEVEGKKLPAGKYGLHMAIYENGQATVIFSRNSSSWGSFWYDPEEDALRVEVKTVENPFTNVLTYGFAELGPDYGVLALDWERKRIPVKIGVDIKDQVLASMRDELRGLSGFGWQGPLSAANYCLQNNVNHEEALRWADQAIAGSNGSFQPIGVKAGLLVQTGRSEEAAELTRKAADKADVNQLNQLGYTMLQAGQVDQAIEFFRLNVERNPDVANCYDSLGEAFMAKGNKEKAIENFKLSLSKNPPPLVKANSIKNLKQLGVEVGEETN